MNCLMHDCEPYGHLLVGSAPMLPPQLARLVGITAKECATLMRELEQAGVFSRTDEGTIFSRRMVRDEALRERRANGGQAGAEHGVKGAEHGKKGGRPRQSEGGSETPLTADKQPPPAFASASAEDKTEEHHPPGGSDDDDTETLGNPTAYGAVTMALRKAGIARANPGHQGFRMLVDAGVTTEEFLGYVEAAKKADDPFRYLVATVAKERERAKESAGKVLRGSVTQADPLAWRKSDRGIRAMARQVGAGNPRDGESYAEYEARVVASWRRAGEPTPQPATEAA
jgi:hypothetical protein